MSILTILTLDNMKKYSFVFIAFCIVSIRYSFAQITFQKAYGRINGTELAKDVQQTADGGYIILGTASTSLNPYSSDLYLVKTDANGDTLWTKTFNISMYDDVYSIKQTLDGGYIISGESQDLNGGSFYSLIKTDSLGQLLWSNFYDYYEGSQNSISLTSDSGFIITGAYNKIRLFKKAANGNLQWSKSYSSGNNESSSFAQQTSDGGYIIVGNTNFLQTADVDIKLIKTDSLGNLIWSKNYRISNSALSYSMQQTIDGGYIISGVVSTLISTWTYVYNFFLIKTDSSGNISWNKKYRSISNSLEPANFYVKQTHDGGYIALGNLRNGPSMFDICLIRTNSIGDTLWTRKVNGSNDQKAIALNLTSDGGYLICGYPNNFVPGNGDFLLIKTDSIGKTGCNLGSSNLSVGTFSIGTVFQSTIVVSDPSIPYTVNITPSIGGGMITTNCSNVGIHDYAEDGFAHVFPNPTEGFFTISFDKTITSGKLQIFNLIGEKVYDALISNQTQTEIHMEGISPGIYFVKVFDVEYEYCRILILK